MPSLKSLRLRIKSVKSTQKITSAMKMVAAAKLRRAQERLTPMRRYADGVHQLLDNVLQEYPDSVDGSFYLPNKEYDTKPHLIIVSASDRGLCGGFNTTVIREARHKIKDLQKHNIPVKLLCFGRKARELLKKEYGKLILETEVDLLKTGLPFDLARQIAAKLIAHLEEGTIGKVTAVYSIFRSAISQEIVSEQLLPFKIEPSQEKKLYEFEPNHVTLLHSLFVQHFATLIYKILVETNASEQGARMTAMDHATRNATDVIRSLELRYNRTRQASITGELIEIISGAEAL